MLYCKHEQRATQNTGCNLCYHPKPTNGNIAWQRIEALLVAVGCHVIEGNGSSVTFEKDGVRVYFHRPHPQKEALRYRVEEARDFLIELGVKP